MSRSAVVKSDNALVRYFKDTLAELAKVTWPTRQEGARLTGIVLAVTIVATMVLALIDTAFGLVIKWLLAF